jgi:hypothetical protein
MKQAIKEATPVHRGDWTGPGKARKRARKDFTTEEVNCRPASDSRDAEWVDFKGLHARFGIRRSLGYALAAEGKIHSVSLRHRNRTRGKRLFSCDSIRSYLSQCGKDNGDA